MISNLNLFESYSCEDFVHQHPEVLLQIDELLLSKRTQNSLFSEDIKYVGDLIQLTEREMLRIPNFGRKCLKEIIDALGCIELCLSSRACSWPPDNIEALRNKYSSRLSKAKERIYLRSHRVTAFSLEEELFDIANQFGARNAQIFVQRMGWDGRGGTTLDTVGKKYNMTRERIRQICSKIEKKILLSKPPTSFLTQAIKLVKEGIPEKASVIEEALALNKISSRPFRIEGIVSAAKLFDCELQICIEKVGRKKTRLVVPASSEGVPRKINQEARKYIEHWGAGTVADIISVIEDKYKIIIPSNLVKLTLESLEGFSWLDKETQWFWFLNCKRNRILNLIRKIASVAEYLTLDDLRSGIMRTHRTKGYSPPKRVLAAICEQSNRFIIRNNVVKAHPPLSWEETLEGTNEYDLVLALKTFGPVLTRADLETLCTNKGMNRSSFYIYIGYSPLIQRYSRGVYGLRGARVSVSHIESLRKKVEKSTKEKARLLNTSRVLIDYGRSTDGTFWVIYRLSSNTIFSGVLTTPSPLKKYIHGEFNLYSADGALMGIIKSNNGSTWGLGSFFSRRGAEENDHLILIYDISSRAAKAELGTEELLDRFTENES